jgi:adenylate cyclase
MKYGCMGETVNLAGRLESFSIGGQIHISENTRKLVRMDLVIAREKSFIPKGGRGEMKFYRISGIGQKRIPETAEDAIRWTDLPTPEEVRFSLLDGKVVEKKKHKGQLTRISADGELGILKTGTALDPLRDLMIRIRGQEVYAKVLEFEEDGCRIGFTEKKADLSEMLTHASAG